MRTYSVDLVSKAVAQYGEVTGFEPVSWLSDLNNVALTNENNDIALFQREGLNPISGYGHYFFWSRGKEALKAAKEFLKEFFTGPYNIEIIMGLTPVTHKGALWMNSQLGFKKLGIVPSHVGDLQVVRLTKEEWSKNQ
jgi:hypothetical protein